VNGTPIASTATAATTNEILTRLVIWLTRVRTGRSA
jgi:hypothetical protein